MKVVWFIVGITALVLGVVGAVLPLLPTTPFILLAAYAFARSSDRLHGWLISHRVFGPMIRDWQAHGAIDPRAKLLSSISMLAVFCLSLWVGVGQTVLIIQAVVLCGAATFVLSRPNPPQPASRQHSEA